MQAIPKYQPISMPVSFDIGLKIAQTRPCVVLAAGDRRKTELLGQITGPSDRRYASASMGSKRVDPAPTDPVAIALNAILQIAFDQAAAPCALFVRSIERAIQAHLDHGHGLSETILPPRRRGLTGAQERRAKHFLVENMADDASIAQAADACSLSRGYFIRAFKDTTGETPHRWLSGYRVQKAKDLLLGPLPIVEIALACGFSDQSHLTRVFAKMIGVPPGVWRREYRGEGGSAAVEADTVAPATW